MTPSCASSVPIGLTEMYAKNDLPDCVCTLNVSSFAGLLLLSAIMTGLVLSEMSVPVDVCNFKMVL